MTEITAVAVLAKAREIAEAHPSAVYEMPEDGEMGVCYYTRGELAGRSGCLFGQALLDLGVPHLVLADADEEAFSIQMLLPSIGCELTKYEESVLWQAQKKQDVGKPMREVFEPTRTVPEE